MTLTFRDLTPEDAYRGFPSNLSEDVVSLLIQSNSDVHRVVAVDEHNRVHGTASLLIAPSLATGKSSLIVYDLCTEEEGTVDTLIDFCRTFGKNRRCSTITILDDNSALPL